MAMVPLTPKLIVSPAAALFMQKRKDPNPPPFGGPYACPEFGSSLVTLTIHDEGTRRSSSASSDNRVLRLSLFWMLDIGRRERRNRDREWNMVQTPSLERAAADEAIALPTWKRPPRLQRLNPTPFARFSIRMVQPARSIHAPTPSAMPCTSTCQEFYYEKSLMSSSTIPIPDDEEGKRLHWRPEAC